MANVDPFDDQRRKNARHSHLSKEQREARFALREMLWDAIDNKKDISIVETSKALGLYNSS